MARRLEGMKLIEYPAYILCQDVFKIYKIKDIEVVALRGLDLRVDKGELVAIIGPSGSGKTTLLSILAGFDTPSAGKVEVGGRDMLKTSPAKLVAYRRKDVGFVWQQTGRNLFPFLTAEENVELPLVLQNKPREQRTKRAQELLRAVGLEPRKNHTPDRLSGGEQQRVSIAVALANNPPLLLADEPTGELDSQTAKEIMDIFHLINAEYGTTIVIVTHDESIAKDVHRVVSIKDGRTSSEILRRPTFQRPGAHPEDNIDEYAVIDSAGRLQIPTSFLERLRITRRARVNLDPDHVSIWPEGKGRQDGGE